MVAAMLLGMTQAGMAWPATPLLIAPTIVHLPPAGRRSATIDVTNQSDAPVAVQLRGYDWSQPVGEDVLTPSASLAISPGIATIAPHARQTFRLLDLAPPGRGEKAFRIRINELPGSSKPEAIAVNLEFLVPVFRGGEGTPPRPGWTRDGDALIAVNPGERHIRMTGVSAIMPDGARTALSGSAPIYLLGGARRRIVVPRTSVRVVGATDDGAFDVALSPAAR